MSRIVDIDNREALVEAMTTLFSVCHFKHMKGCLAASCKECLDRFFEPSHQHLLPTVNSEYIKLSEAYDIGTLEDWYINSIDNTDEPVWTDAHLEELMNDFYLFPRETEVDGNE